MLYILMTMVKIQQVEQDLELDLEAPWITKEESLQHSQGKQITTKFNQPT